MKAHWTDKALLRLQQIHDHIANDSAVNAQRFVDRLTRKAALIASQPHAGVVVKKYRRDDIRETYEGPYAIRVLDYSLRRLNLCLANVSAPTMHTANTAPSRPLVAVCVRGPNPLSPNQPPI